MDAIPKILNLDSLSDSDKELLLQYQDSFKNDLREVLEVFNLDQKKKKEDTTVYDMDRSSHVEVALDVSSRILINGRVVQLSTVRGKPIALTGAGFYPTFAYYHKIGIYVALATTFYTDYTIAHASPVPAVSPSAGYSHTFFLRWLLGTSYIRTFNTYGSAESRILLNNALSFTSAIDIWKHFILASSCYVYWSSDHSSTLPTDERSSLELMVSLRKEFRIHHFIGAKEFTITPNLNFYFANDNRTFVTALGISDVKKVTGADTIVRTQNVNDFFGFLDLEPSVNFDWRIRNLDINFTPVMAIPFNIFYPAKDVRILNPKVYRFYVQAGIKYLFCVKKKNKHASQQVSGSLH